MDSHLGLKALLLVVWVSSSSGFVRLQEPKSFRAKTPTLNPKAFRVNSCYSARRLSETGSADASLTAVQDQSPAKAWQFAEFESRFRVQRFA